MQKQIKCDSIICYDEAKIKKLYVEDIQHPDFGNNGECVVVETADTRGTSLIQSRGKTGKETAKIKALKSGVGCVLNGYEKVIEVRTNLVNKAGLHTKILDMPSQSFKQLKGENGVEIIDGVDFITISGTQYKNGGGAQLLVNNVIRGLECSETVRIEETPSSIKLHTKGIRCIGGLKLQESSSEYILSLESSLQEKLTDKKDCISLLDTTSNSLNRLCFPSAMFTVVSEKGISTITPVQQIQSYKNSGVELLSGNKVKTLEGGRGIVLNVYPDKITISQE